MSRVYKILHEHLAVLKLGTRWIPHNLTEAQKLHRINRCREMVQRFAGGDSDAIDDMVTEDTTTVTADWHTDNRLRLVLGEIREKRPPNRILLYHDNASPHTATQTTNDLGTLSVEIPARPPYLPVFVPCDFYLFPNIKGKLRGKWYTGDDEAAAAFDRAVEAAPKIEELAPRRLLGVVLNARKIAKDGHKDR
ncbi:Histone-lysine N-methyltransferase SETMAR [Eumeta japonica]|uniref:Histone-lysine N-methyltransferase SETMAR n=1 Tax=Eumeta variegata TaxID=151549 RepID=A0A4C1UGU1_EUMVA|nr:Histone-lysine N-methyltransferase SETMAR [Eumeta japonica]